MRHITFNVGIRLKSLLISPVSKVPPGGQIKSLCDRNHGRRGLELSMDCCITPDGKIRYRVESIMFWFFFCCFFRPHLCMAGDNQRLSLEMMMFVYYWNKSFVCGCVCIFKLFNVKQSLSDPLFKSSFAISI